MDDSVNSGNFSVRDDLPLIRKDSVTHMHFLAVCMKEALPFGWDLSLENFQDSYVLYWLYAIQCLNSFSSVDHILRLTVFDAISHNIVEVLSINPSANVYVFGDFNFHHKDWLTCSGETDRPGELCYYLKRLYSDC